MPRIHLYRCLWGVIKQAGGRFEIPEALAEVRKLGPQYKGVEVPIKVIMEFGAKAFVKELKANDLKVIPLIFSSGPVAPGWDAKHRKTHPKPARAWQTHSAVLQAQLYEVADAIPPHLLTKVTSHSGSDAFSAEESFDFFSDVLEWTRSKFPVIEVNHETHRGRVLYSPWVTRSLLNNLNTRYAMPTATAATATAAVSSADTAPAPLHLVADYSHHVNVTEAMSSDAVASDSELSTTLQSFSPLVRHVHARYGYDQGPQIPDPRAPEYAEYVKAHDQWWAHIVRAAADAKLDTLTVTPEHGPAPYQQQLPYTQQPLASTWDVNSWVGERFLANAQKALDARKKKAAK